MQEAGFAPRRVNDGGGEWEDTPTVDAAADAITAVDEANVSFHDPERGLSHVAFIVLGNADHELVSDHTARDTATGRRFTEAIDAWATAEEERE
jgi:hypothetical protein